MTDGTLVWDSSLSSVFKGYIQEQHDRQNNVIFFGNVHKLIIPRFSILLYKSLIYTILHVVGDSVCPQYREDGFSKTLIRVLNKTTPGPARYM